MRQRNEVLEKFYELRALKLKERKEQFLAMIPRNCFFNCRLRVKGNSQVGFCQNSQVLQSIQAKVFVCNEEIVARRCRIFRCRNTEESVEKDFEEILRSPVRCGDEYPKLAVLIWFLQEYSSPKRGQRFARSLTDCLKSLFRLIAFRWW